MIPELRQQNILKIIENNEFVSIATLCQKLNVSHMTIRRDLNKLESEGLVIQISGGVKSFKKINSEPSHQDKTLMFSDEKRKIGQYAASIIPKDSCIYLDAGTTSLALCTFICNRDDLTIISNDLAVLNYLSTNSDNNLIIAGGKIRSKNLSTVGPLAALCLSKLNIDIAFLSASSFNITGISTPDEEKVVVKEQVCKQASKIVLITDSSKYGQIATYIAVPLEVIDLIITDKNLSQTAESLITSKNIELKLV